MISILVFGNYRLTFFISLSIHCMVFDSWISFSACLLRHNQQISNAIVVFSKERHLLTSNYANTSNHFGIYID